MWQPMSEQLEDRRLLAAITVDTTTDEVGGDTSSITNLIAAAGGTGISLREAVIAANNTAGGDAINLPPGLYALTINEIDENNSATGDLDIRDETIIQSTVVGVNATIDASGLGNDRAIHKNSTSA
jgi:hypothetical protein